MKKVILILAIILIAGLNGLFAQQYSMHQIPSYNVPLTANFNGFKEHKDKGNPTREKRDMDIVITSSSTAPVIIFATVWVVKDNGSQVLGPFTIFPDEPLSVPIDNDKWSAVISCDWDVYASVWIE
jgi:hypothetical protein